MDSSAAVDMLTIFLLFGTPFLIALLVFAGWLIHSNRKNVIAERSRDTYERLAREKLDVIKTAIAMGHSDDQIRELDARLERLVGKDKLQHLLHPRNPQPPAATAELHDADLLAEYDRQRDAASQAE